jgi:hypothetical protein
MVRFQETCFEEVLEWQGRGQHILPDGIGDGILPTATLSKWTRGSDV